MKHAPYAIINDFNVIYGKTTKTACGKKGIKTDNLVSRDKTDCPDCIAQIAKDRAEYAEMEKAAKYLGLA